MRISNLILLVIGTIILTGGAMAGGYLLSRAEVEPKEQTKTVAQAQSESGAVLSVQEPGAAGQLTDQPDAGLERDTRQPAIPGPDEFEQYLEFSDSEGTLAAEILEGTGDTAETGDQVAVVYQGWLTDGELFDESRLNENGQTEAFSFILGQNTVIQGWEQGVLGMKVGGKRRLVIPSHLAYGETGQNSIPPSAMLIFDVELVQVDKPAINDGSQSGL